MIIAEVNRVHSAGTRWAIVEVTNLLPTPSEIAKVYGAIVQSGEYIGIKEIDGNYNFLKNPDYKKPKWHEENYNLAQIRNGAITAGFALLVGISLWLIQNREKAREYKELHQQLDKANEKIDSLISLPIFRKK